MSRDVAQPTLPGGAVAGLFVTLALHAALVAGVLFVKQEPPPIHAPRDFVTAKLVRLGKPRPKELLPRLEEAPAPAPVPAPAPAPVPAVVPAPTTKVSDDAHAAPAAKKPDKPDKSKAKPESAADALKRASERARAFGKQADEREGDPSGSRAGDAERAAEGDRYATQVSDVLKRGWDIPKGLVTEAELKKLVAVVRIRVDRGGRVQSAKISQRSGNRYFDSSIEEMLANTRRLPPPPPAIADSLVRSGFEIEFAGKDQ